MGVGELTCPCPGQGLPLLPLEEGALAEGAHWWSRTTRDAGRLLLVLSEELLKAQLTSYRKVFPFFSEL